MTQAEQDLLRFLAPPGLLKKIEQSVVLYLAAGIDRTEALVGLPGLTHATRCRDAVAGLIARKHVEQIARGRLRLLTPGFGMSEQDARKILRARAKLMEVIRHAADPALQFRVRGFDETIGDWGEEEMQGLLALLRESEDYADSDRKRTRRLRRPRLAFVDRRVSAEYRHRLHPDRPRPAPADVEDRAVALLVRHCDDLAMRADYEARVHALCGDLRARPDNALDHWWRIVEEIGPRFPEVGMRWREAGLRILSYLARRAPPSSLRDLWPDDWQAHIADYPVPECGYGPWVEQEIYLWKRFRGRYAARLNTPAVRALWVAAHEKADQVVRLRPTMERGGGDWEVAYQRALWAAADEFADSTGSKFRELWSKYEARKLLRRVVRYARDVPTGATAPKRDSTAIPPDLLPTVEHARRLLRLLSRQRADLGVSEEALSALQGQFQVLLGRKRSRRAGRAPKYAAVRSTSAILGKISFRFGTFPTEILAKELRSVFSRLERGTPRMQTMTVARGAVADFLVSRARVDVKNADGGICRLSLRDASVAAGAPDGLLRVLEQSGLADALHAQELVSLRASVCDGATAAA